MTNVPGRLALMLALLVGVLAGAPLVALAQDDDEPSRVDRTVDSLDLDAADVESEYGDTLGDLGERWSDLPLRESDTPFRFGGTARLVGQLADRSGLYQQVPDDYARFEMTPTLFVYDVPFAANVLLSTEESTSRQSINSVVFGLDFQQLQGALLSRAYDKLGELQALKSIEEESGIAAVRDSLTAAGADVEREVARLKDLADLEKLKDRAFSESMGILQGLGVVSATEKFFAMFPALEFGVTYPRYTPLTLSSAPVTGANIEFNPGEFYLAVAGGRSQRATNGQQVIWRRVPPVPEFEDTVIAPAYNRSLYSGRIGYGRKDAARFFITALVARDDVEAPVDSAALDTLPARYAPKENYVLGFETFIPIVEDYVTLEGEIAGSVTTGDLNSPSFANDDIPDFLVDIVNPRISSFIDFAYSLKGTVDVRESGTKVSGLIRMVGPGYASFGVPSLRTDNLRYEARLDQRLVNRQVQVTGFYRTDQDNLGSTADSAFTLKSATTTVSSWGVGLGLTFKGLPYLRLNFAPYHQFNDVSGERAVDNTTSTFSAMTGYNFRTGPLRNVTTLSFSRQASSTLGGLADYAVDNVNAGYAAYFQFPLSLNAGVGVSTYSIGADSSSSILSLDFGGSYTAFDIWEMSAGLTLSNQEDTDSRVGYFLGSTLALWDYGFFDLRVQKNTYDAFFDYQDFDEFVLYATLSTNW